MKKQSFPRNDAHPYFTVPSNDYFQQKKYYILLFAISGKAGAAGGAKKEEEKKEEIKFDPVTPDMIKKDKGFVKANKKYSKEYETLKKKQNKVVNIEYKAFTFLL